MRWRVVDFVEGRLEGFACQDKIDMDGKLRDMRLEAVK
jgi:hypothetical protein